VGDAITGSVLEGGIERVGNMGIYFLIFSPLLIFSQPTQTAESPFELHSPHPFGVKVAILSKGRIGFKSFQLVGSGSGE
jgi:hypothetical protein